MALIAGLVFSGAGLLAFATFTSLVFLITLYLRTVFRRVDGAQARLVPPQARDTLNTLAEGVLFERRTFHATFATKDKFEGITINDAASEGNFIRSNGVFTAVCDSPSITFTILDPLEIRWRWCHRCAEGIQLY